MTRTKRCMYNETTAYNEYENEITNITRIMCITLLRSPPTILCNCDFVLIFVIRCHFSLYTVFDVSLRIVGVFSIANRLIWEIFKIVKFRCVMSWITSFCRLAIIHSVETQQSCKPKLSLWYCTVVYGRSNVSFLNWFWLCTTTQLTATC